MKTILALSLGFCMCFSGFCFAWCPPGDLTGDCRVNLDDLAILAGNWLTEGENAVPDVVGMTQSAAETAIAHVYLAVGTVMQEYSETVSSGLVISQDPVSGTLLTPDKKVNLVVSLGPDFSIIPDITWVEINDLGIPGHEAFDGRMSKYETTNAQYCQYLNTALISGDIMVVGDIVIGIDGSNPGVDFEEESYYNLAGSGWSNDGAANGGASRIGWTGSVFTVDSGFENYPVTFVSWYGATAFADYYDWRLPTEWEWQAAADYDGSYNYGCGTKINNSITNYYNSVHPDGTAVVGAFGTYGYGMCDMAGNVWEWTSSCYYLECNNGYRVIRGGSWCNFDFGCAVSCRSKEGSDNADFRIGFRVCR